jgi:hypothetical protein
VVELEERMGFGGAVKVGCDLATTPYVLVVQHDRPFIGRSEAGPFTSFGQAQGQWFTLSQF